MALAVSLLSSAVEASVLSEEMVPVCRLSARLKHRQTRSGRPDVDVPTGCDSEFAPRYLQGSYSQSSFTRPSGRIANYLQIKLSSLGTHSQNVGLAPTERRCQGAHFAQQSLGPVVDFAPKEGDNVKS